MWLAAVTSSWLATLSSANQREILFLFYFYELRHAVSTWIGTEQSGLAQIHASEFVVVVTGLYRTLPE